jgi:chromosome segregation ATPase
MSFFDELAHPRELARHLSDLEKYDSLFSRLKEKLNALKQPDLTYGVLMIEQKRIDYPGIQEDLETLERSVETISIADDDFIEDIQNIAEQIESIKNKQKTFSEMNQDGVTREVQQIIRDSKILSLTYPGHNHDISYFFDTLHTDTEAAKKFSSVMLTKQLTFEQLQKNELPEELKKLLKSFQEKNIWYPGKDADMSELEEVIKTDFDIAADLLAIINHRQTIASELKEAGLPYDLHELEEIIKNEYIKYPDREFDGADFIDVSKTDPLEAAGIALKIILTTSR